MTTPNNAEKILVLEELLQQEFFEVPIQINLLRKILLEPMIEQITNFAQNKTSPRK